MKNKRGEVQYPPKYWDKISLEAKDLVNKMLSKDPKTRISAREALNHQWFNTENTNAGNYLHEVGENIKLLNEEMKLEATDLQHQDINMITMTPILAGRGLDKYVP